METFKDRQATAANVLSPVPCPALPCPFSLTLRNPTIRDELNGSWFGLRGSVPYLAYFHHIEISVDRAPPTSSNARPARIKYFTRSILYSMAALRYHTCKAITALPTLQITLEATWESNLTADYEFLSPYYLTNGVVAELKNQSCREYDH